MGTRVHGATLAGIDGAAVVVEVDAGRGLPGFHIVGRADRVVNESRDRIRSAFRACGLPFPPGRITVNLAPTELPKSGSALDLPIALGIAAAGVELPAEELAGTLFAGELGLDGALRGVRGALALAGAARAAALARAVVPLENLGEAALCPGVSASGADSLPAVLRHLRGEEPLALGRPGDPQPAAAGPDLADVRGQDGARRALEIAAAGGHNLLLVGPPGERQDHAGAPAARAAARPRARRGARGDAHPRQSPARSHRRALIARPPLRAPHQSISTAASGRRRPPAAPARSRWRTAACSSWTSCGVPARRARGAAPAARGRRAVRIARAEGVLALPARFQLVAAMNPCPCGWRGDALRECTCDDALVARYRSRLSGPMLDRIDLRVAVAPVSWREIARAVDDRNGSEAARGRVAAAHERRRERGGRANAELPALPDSPELELASDARQLLERAVDGLGLSLRALVRVLRVSRSIADLESSPGVAREHVAEALSFRAL